MTDDRVTQIRTRIENALAPASLEVIDDSAAHAGHEGARTHGGGHYTVRVVAQGFAGKGPVERHRMVYAALGDLMQSDIHALSIKALAPGE